MKTNQENEHKRSSPRWKRVLGSDESCLFTFENAVAAIADFITQKELVE